jgi:hypothetical protein
LCLTEASTTPRWLKPGLASSWLYQRWRQMGREAW